MAKLGRQTRVHCTYGSGKTKGHGRLSLPVAQSRRSPPMTALQLLNTLPASIRLSFPQAVHITPPTAEPAWWSCTSINTNSSDLKPWLHITTTFFFFWDGNVLSRAYQTPYRGSLTAFVWKEDEEGKEKCGESSDLKWQSLDWRSNPTETITVLKNHRSWIKTFFPSSKVAINQPSHSVIPSILTEQPIDQESLLSKNIWAPLCGETFQAYGGGFQYFFEDQEN